MVSASASAPPPDICSLLCPDCVLLDVQVSSKKRAIDLMSELLSHHQAEVSEKMVLDSLHGRERIGGTGLGHGVAIPHGRLSGEGVAPMAAFIRLSKAVDYEAPDGKPVDLLLSLVVPEESTSEHLQTLAKLAEIFSDPERRKALREAADIPEILHILCA